MYINYCNIIISIMLVYSISVVGNKCNSYIIIIFSQFDYVCPRSICIFLYKPFIILMCFNVITIVHRRNIAILLFIFKLITCKINSTVLLCKIDFRILTLFSSCLYSTHLCINASEHGPIIRSKCPPYITNSETGLSV